MGTTFVHPTGDQKEGVKTSYTPVLRLLHVCMQVDDILECAASEHEPVHGVHLDIGSFGDINSFFWSHNLPFHPEHIKCSVAYGEHHLSRSWYTAAWVRVRFEAFLLEAIDHAMHAEAVPARGN